jgi:hypothetical protein
VIIAFLGLQLPAQAALVGTDTALRSEQGQATRTTIQNLLEREDVKAALMERGVRLQDVQARVDALSDDEAAALASKIDQMPAAGSDVLGVLVLIFLILLFTDILGFTDIFPFVKKPAKH